MRNSSLLVDRIKDDGGGGLTSTPKDSIINLSIEWI